MLTSKLENRSIFRKTFLAMIFETKDTPTAFAETGQRNNSLQYATCNLQQRTKNKISDGDKTFLSLRSILD